MNELWRTEGVFWEEDNQDRRLNGTLMLFEDGHCELSLFGSFSEDLSELFSGRNRNAKRINGITKKYKYIAVLYPIEVSRNIGIPHIATSSYRSRVLLASHSYHDKYGQFALSLTAELSGLDKWIGISGLKSIQI